MIAFGPVPSRRLGNSLGINNIPPKYCSYSCIYCQLGRTNSMQAERTEFYMPGHVIDSVSESIGKYDGKIDYLTFVPDGEPTLDINLGSEIKALKELEIKIAVITNSSLLWMEDVREELALADWVSVKLDSVTKDTWHRIDRPHGRLKLEKILTGIKDFSDIYEGELVTETMLIDGLNNTEKELEQIAEFIETLSYKMRYVSIPIRPPAEEWVRTPSPEKMNMAYQIFTSYSLDTELLTGYEGNEFSLTGNAKDDILAITSVHPMRDDAVKEFLNKAGEPELINNLVNEGKMVEIQYKGHQFYLRNLNH